MTLNKQKTLGLSLVSLLLSSGIVGCAGNVTQPRDARAVGEWRFHLPTTQSPIAESAYGQGGSSRPAPLVAEARPEHEELATAQTKTRLRHLRRPLAAQPPAAASQPERVVKTTPELHAENTATAAPDSAEQRYAQRAANSRQLESYRGGDAIVISVSVLAVVLLIVLLILLLR